MDMEIITVHGLQKLQNHYQFLRSAAYASITFSIDLLIPLLQTLPGPNFTPRARYVPNVAKRSI